MSYFQDQIKANLNTDAITDILSEVANAANGVTFISLPTESQTFFALSDLKAELEEEEDEELLEMIDKVEAKSSTESLVYVLDNEGKTHKFTL